MSAKRKRAMTPAEWGALGGRPPKDPSEKVVPMKLYLTPEVLERLEAIRAEKGFKTANAYLADVARRIAVGERAP